ncbi:MAG: hypothetical protein OFPI_44980 [Osedax symbiont Rs2]|nr:MAG: hypothetical protein OFPI_44980 [Osedax symbiont Rs2]EPJ45021.1 MAG: hypothetical protein OFPII_30540 [Osedax symbiont Rs1]
MYSQFGRMIDSSKPPALLILVTKNKDSIPFTMTLVPYYLYFEKGVLKDSLKNINFGFSDFSRRGYHKNQIWCFYALNLENSFTQINDNQKIVNVLKIGKLLKDAGRYVQSENEYFRWRVDDNNLTEAKRLVAVLGNTPAQSHYVSEDRKGLNILIEKGEEPETHTSRGGNLIGKIPAGGTKYTFVSLNQELIKTESINFKTGKSVFSPDGSMRELKISIPILQGRNNRLFPSSIFTMN